MKSVESHIEAPVSRVWDLVGDLPSWAERLRTIDSIADLTGAGPGLGARFAVHQPGLPRAVYEVTDWRPGAGFTWVSRTRLLATTATHEIRADGSGALLALGISWDGPLAWLAARLFGSKAESYIQYEAQDFAHLAEGSGND